jgi:peptidoglycan hydrolase CwlO-like protein
MSAQNEFTAVKRQRNLFAAAAALFIIASIALSLPRVVRYRNELQANNKELIRLQQAIVTIQKQIVQAQDEIRALQKKIADASTPHA